MALQVAYPRQVEAEQTVLPDFGQNIINAFAKGAAINQRARDLKNDLSKIALLEREQQFKEARWPAEFAQKEREIGARNLMHEMNIDARTRGLDLREMDLRQKWDERKTAAEQFANVSQGLAEVDPNAPDAPNKFWNIVGDNPYGASSPGGRQAQRNWWHGYNTNAAHKGSQFRSNYAAWEKDFRDAFGGGYPVGTDILMDRSAWKQQYEKYDEQGKGVGKPTGNLFIPIQDPATGKVQGYITKEKKFVESKIKEYADWQKQFKTLPRQQSVPGLDVYPQSEPDAQNPLSDEDAKALNWAKNHPDDPRAAQIQRRLGINQ
jgi:hypothetical protein